MPMQSRKCRECGRVIDQSRKLCHYCYGFSLSTNAHGLLSMNGVCRRCGTRKSSQGRMFCAECRRAAASELPLDVHIQIKEMLGSGVRLRGAVEAVRRGCRIDVWPLVPGKAELERFRRLVKCGYIPVDVILVRDPETWTYDYVRQWVFARGQDATTQRWLQDSQALKLFRVCDD